MNVKGYGVYGKDYVVNDYELQSTSRVLLSGRHAVNVKGYGMDGKG